MSTDLKPFSIKLSFPTNIILPEEQSKPFFLFSKTKIRLNEFFIVNQETKKRKLKGTVSIISSDSLDKDGNAQLKPVEPLILSTIGNILFRSVKFLNVFPQ